MVEDRYNQRRSPSLSGPSRSVPSGTPAAPAKPAAPAAKPVTSSSFLTRIANTAIRDAGGPAPSSAASPKWMGSSIDHSSPAANLSSRLRWVETAFKQEGAQQGMQMQAPTQAQRPAQQMQQPLQQAAAPKPQIADAGDFKAAVILMRKRMQAIHLEMEALDKELAEIEQKMGQAPSQQTTQQ